MAHIVRGQGLRAGRQVHRDQQGQTQAERPVHNGQAGEKKKQSFLGKKLFSLVGNALTYSILHV